MLTFLKNLLKNGELVAFIIIAASILGVAAWGQHHKRAAEELQDELVRARLREQACSDAVASLEAEGKAREEAAKKALEDAQAEANKYALRADQLLRKPAAVPGDDCASAKVRAAAWLKSRGQ